MISLDLFQNLQLLGGFTIFGIEVTEGLLVDAIGREAIARTRIVGQRFSITIHSGLSDDELSVTIYHEALEAATVATIQPPPSVRDFNEGDFERAAYRAHEQFGVVSPENLNRMLQSYGF
jgi:hypothetical protein